MISTEEEKIIKIYDHVRKTMTWNEFYTIIASGKLDKVYEAKQGTSGDINLILALMLKAVNIKAIPVIISTNDNGIVKESYPIISQFNHTINRQRKKLFIRCH